MLHWIACLALAHPETAVPTGSEILKRCQLAYDSVQTFDQHVRGTVGTSKITARVRFKRPGLFQVDGSAMDSSLYSVVSNSQRTYVLDHVHWVKAKCAEEGFGMITGTGGIPGCTVPTALLHFSWSELLHFRDTPDSEIKVEATEMNGRDTYRVTVTRPQPTAVRIDSKTYFLVRILTPLTGNNQADSTFEPPIINRPISAKVFK